MREFVTIYLTDKMKEGLSLYKYTDYFDDYGRIMQFNKNKTEPFHRWYPFVEGYSKEFIKSIIAEIGDKNITCLEPFSGSGTTALELQSMGIKCFSFEVNPLMYLIAKTKLENTYQISKIKEWHNIIKVSRNNCINVECSTEFKTLYEAKDKKKWNYHKKAAEAIEKLKIGISLITEPIYKDLFTVALASILLDASNLYRNGKCLSYKKNWKSRILSEEEIFNIFDNKIIDEFIPDIRDHLVVNDIGNKDRLYLEDARLGIDKLSDSSIDLVITSPPYLNSRDYTDTYMLELKTLQLTRNSKEIRMLREKTLRSHVQIKWDDYTALDNNLVNDLLKKLKIAINTDESKNWNDSIIDMVRLYFVDIEKIFDSLYLKMKKGGKIYFNVSNSAYFNVLINTLDICASIAENVGFQVIEIRRARYLKSSPQQKEKIGKILEGVILLQR